ncbi:MAG: hypothetical protein OXI22_18790 [Defluviicoccus sp.]|nr:hypothetical protein [Defluviicoccus sp.]MDE0385936.1 hypothetical protein [Defluviicoccus sp.]
MPAKRKEPVQITRRQVRVKPHAYQPSKAELEEPIDLTRPDGSRPTVDEIVDALFAPVEIVEDEDA